MRAQISVTQACIYGAGAFLAVIGVCGAAAAFAIGGPITKYEASNFSQVAGDLGHNAKAAARHLRAGVCRRLPTDVGHVLRCPKRGAKPHLATASPAPHPATHSAASSTARVSAHPATHIARQAHAPRHPARRHTTRQAR